MRAVPGSGIREGANNSGKTAQAADHRSGAGQRRSITSAATIAKGNHHVGGVARHSASSRSAAHVSAGQNASYRRAAQSKKNRLAAGATMTAIAPASTSGTSTNETSGIATRLTASPASDSPPNTANVSGASASRMAH